MSNPESPAIIIRAAQHGWYCSVCDGFVRKDAQICKHCQRPFANAGLITDSPRERRLFAALIGGILTFFLSVAAGGVIGNQFSRGYGWLADTYVFEGFFYGALVGSVPLLIILIIGLWKT